MEGHASVLSWLLEHGCPRDELAICGQAACSGDMQTLLAAKQHGGILTAHTMRCAALYGILPMCQYLHAAKSGNVDMLRWLLQQSCPMNADTVCTAAAAGGHIDVMALLQAELPPFTADTWTGMLAAAGASRKLAAAQWLRQRGADWPAVLQHRDREWQGEVLAWARAEGCTVPTEAL
jgi:hypothetical protein